MAMKCMTQMPVLPMDRAPPISQRTRAGPVAARALAVSRRPSMHPMAEAM